MNVYMKRFIYASLFYLAVATVFGALNGALSLGYWAQFGHTHFNLLGFMSMMVFGIGYFILPRFNGTDLRWPDLVALHFWLGNISLLGMVIFRGLAVQTGDNTYQGLFIASASIQAVSIFMFVINMWVSLAVKKSETAHAPAPANQPPVSATPAQRPATPAPTATATPQLTKSIMITPDTRVIDLIDALPAAQRLLASAGLAALSLPGHLDHVRARGVTLGVACRNHGIDLDGTILELETLFRQNGFGIRSSLNQPQSGGSKGSVSGDRLIGDVIKSYPGARDVFQKHFGSGCFDCPGQAFESIDMACRMHGVEPSKFLQELNTAVG